MKIRVTPEDIARGVPDHVTACPVAFAVQRAFDGETAIVTDTDIEVGGFTYETPEEVAQFIYDFDSEEGVEPFAFELEEGWIEVELYDEEGWPL